MFAEKLGEELSVLIPSVFDSYSRTSAGTQEPNHETVMKVEKIFNIFTVMPITCHSLAD